MQTTQAYVTTSSLAQILHRIFFISTKWPYRQTN